MTQQPHASAKRVFWVVDNGSSHRGQAAIDRLTRRFPNAVMVHTPIHASWLNQAEIYFSVAQHKVLPGRIVDHARSSSLNLFNLASSPAVPGRRSAPDAAGLATLKRFTCDHPIQTLR